jgi:dipeptidyl aminopeptidase/acylaminoacyl peptidase
MTRQRYAGEAFDELIESWLDDRAHGPAADEVVRQTLARTSHARPLPAWLVPERWLPGLLTRRARQGSRLVPVLMLIGLVLLAAAVAIFAIGSQRRLPPPFGLAAPGLVAFVADGHVWTANPDGSGQVQLTFDPRIDGFPTFSRDGTRIAFKRLPEPRTLPNWEEWGDIMVSDIDGGHPLVLDAKVHSPSPIIWSADGRFVVYSRTVGAYDQLFIAATDGSSKRQITSGRQHSWGPSLSPDGRTIAFWKGFPPIGLWVIQSDGKGEHAITRSSLFASDQADWSPDGTTLVYSAGSNNGHQDLWAIGLDGKPEQRIVDASGNDGVPSISPDGLKITYLNANFDGARSRVMVADRDGSNRVAISDVGDWYLPQWSPDARHVLAVDGRIGGGQPIVAILDPLGLEPAATFAIPEGSGTGRADIPTWQRLAP